MATASRLPNGVRMTNAPRLYADKSLRGLPHDFRQIGPQNRTRDARRLGHLAQTVSADIQPSGFPAGDRFAFNAKEIGQRLLRQTESLAMRFEWVHGRIVTY